MAKQSRSKKTVKKEAVKQENPVAAPALGAPRPPSGFNSRLFFIILFSIAAFALAYEAVDYFTAWGNTPKLIKRMLDTAEKKAIYKRYDEAINKYETILARWGAKEEFREEMKQARLSLAKTCKDAEQYLKAIGLYKGLIAEYKDVNKDMYAWLLLELADSYNSILNSDEAVKTYQEIIEGFPGTDWAAEALFGTADAYMTKKDYKNAVKYYDIIVAKYQKGFLSAEALTNKGKIYEELGKESLAVKIYEKVVREFPDIVTEYARSRYNVLSTKTSK